MEGGGEEAGSGKPSPVSPSQPEDKPPVLAWIKAEPTEDGSEMDNGTFRGLDDTCKPSCVSKCDRGDLSSFRGQKRNSGDISHSFIQQEEMEFGKGRVVMRGKDFVVEVDPNYESDEEEEEEVDVKYEVKEESESGEMEVCADSSAAMAGTSSSTRQTGQSLCPASACLASSGESCLPPVHFTGSPADVDCGAILAFPLLGSALPLGGSSLVRGSCGATEFEDSCLGTEGQCDLRTGARSLAERESTSAQKLPKRFPCSECGKKFCSEFNLSRHLSSVHRGVRNHSCSDCGRKFNERSTLERHCLVVHQGVRNHSCPDCGKKFSEKWVLKSHVATVHQGAKNFSCPECGQRFGERSNMVRHFSVMHRRDRNHVCPECSKRFSVKCNLKKHLATVHRRS